MKLLTVQNISELSGVSTHTIRAWERRYNALQPDRTDSNRRQYSYEDLERVRLLKELTENGINISQIASLNIQELRKMQAAFNKAKAPQKESKPIAANSTTASGQKEDIDKFIQLLKDMDLTQLNNQLTIARLSKSAPDFAIHIASPIFQTVGKLVYEGELNISQEHAISALLRNQITQMILALSPLVQTHLPQIALATREGDHHEFGIFLSQALCVYEGFPVVYLGANLPATALAETVNALKIDYTLIGCTPLPAEFTFLSLKEYVLQLQNHLKFPSQIWLGGYLDDISKDEIKKRNFIYSDTFEHFHNALIEIKKQISLEV